MKKLKVYIIMVAVSMGIGVGGTIYVNSRISKSKYEALNVNYTDMQDPKQEKMVKKTALANALIEKINSKKELITMETEISDEIVFDDSFTEFEVFKKVQKMRFYGIGKYSTDLGKITEKDIDFDFDGESVFVTIPRPILNSLEIKEDQTEIYGTDNGFLRFGEIKHTAAEQNQMNVMAKEKMKNELESKESIIRAEEETKKALEELVKTFLLATGEEEFKEFNIKIYFKSV